MSGFEDPWEDYEEEGFQDLETHLAHALDRAFPKPKKGTTVSFDDSDTTEEHERRITRCASCRARIIWLKTEAGKNMPVDADTVEPADDQFDPARHKSHFATCPNANQHRKRT